MWKTYGKSDTSAVAEMEVFVRSHEKGHFMQMPCWADVKTFWSWRGISVYRQNRLAATIGILIRSLPLGFTLFYIPRGPVCDRNDTEIWNELMTALSQLAKEHHALLMYTDPDELDTNSDFRMVMKKLGFKETSDDGFGNIQPQNVFRLELSSRSEEDIFNAFCAKTRYNIGLSLRKGVTVREYSGGDRIPNFILESFYSLMETTGQLDHFSIRDLSYFRGLLNALQDDSRLFIAYLHGQPIAGSIEVFCGKKAWYLYGASANEQRNAMPNYLLQWTMIRRAMERGCEMYDFRGVPGNPSENDALYGLYRFKKGFSGIYTKFTGLFSYSFRPICGRLLDIAMRIRQRSRARTRKQGQRSRLFSSTNAKTS